MEVGRMQSKNPSLLAIGIGIIFLFHDINEAKKESKKFKTRQEIDKYFWNKTVKCYFLKGASEFLKKMNEENIKIKAMEPNRVKMIKKYILENDERMEDWQYDKVYTVSKVAIKFYKVINVAVKYHDITVETQPLRDQLEKINNEVKEKNKYVADKLIELNEVRENMRMLQEQLETQKRGFDILKSSITESQLKLERASKLISLLGDEKVRWDKEITKLRNSQSLIPGNSVTSAGMVAYAGPFTSEFRDDIELSWLRNMDEIGLGYEKDIRMRIFLEDKVQVQRWNIKGLPKDETSKENAIILFESSRWPLMIDPQTQAINFIKNLGKDIQGDFRCIKASNASVMKQVEQCLQNGFWILLENVAIDLDPALEPILLRQFTEELGRGKMITLGEKKVTYHDNFRLFMTTTNPNPHYSPENCAKVTLINFGITPRGLEEQMLATIVILEDKKLEDKKNQIVTNNAKNRADLIRLEDNILNSLNEDQDKILSEDKIIDQLAGSKKKSKEIQQAVKESKVTEKKIDETREKYRGLAFMTSVLFFCIIDLSKIDPMYQYSLQWFVSLFKMSVKVTDPSNDFQTRIRSLTDNFTFDLYKNVCRSLFEKHKLLFSFLMITRILEGEKILNINALRFLLSGPTESYDIPRNPTIWISENSWKDIYSQLCGVNTLERFKGILEFFMEDPEPWKTMYDSDNPHKEVFPGEWEDKMTPFERILIVKVFRSDKVKSAIRMFITKAKGVQYVNIPVVKLSDCYSDSSPLIPLIFILTQGSDPKADFDTFSEREEITKIRSISLGSGQGPKATKMIEDYVKEGGWVLLQNCHLAASWMPMMEMLIGNLKETVHKDFRLWLTSLPSADFPISVLQNSVKITIEPPQGLKDNLKKSYEGLPDANIEFENKDKERSFKKLLYGLCFFHAIIQERRKFGPIGWNIPYEFTYEDLTVSQTQLKSFTLMYEQLDYKVFRIICADINYGGRVTDKIDKRLINTIILSYICHEMTTDKYNMGGESDSYLSPPVSTQKDYLKLIDNLPAETVPEIFGLHSNAAITTEQDNTRALLETVLSIAPTSTVQGGKSREELVQETAQYLQKMTPAQFKIKEVKEIYPPDDYNESMNTVLVQELVRYNNLISLMEKVLVDVQKALKGEVVMSEELEKLAESLSLGQVPEMWAYPRGFLSLKPLNSWIDELKKRCIFFNKWIDKGTPATFWFSGFFFPQAFITGTFQNYARKEGVPIDLLKFRFKPMPMIKEDAWDEKPEDGVYIYGMFIEGSRWSDRKGGLIHSKPKELFGTLPTIHLIPEVDNNIKTPGIYTCPLYKVVSRRGTLSTTGHSTNFVMFLELPTDESENMWVKAGVAAFLSLRY